MANNTRNNNAVLQAVPELSVSENRITEFLQQLVDRMDQIDQKLHNLTEAVSNPEPTRSYNSIAEFADLVGKRHYTVREWCRLARINAKKSEAGRGDAKSWKIPVEELKRYRDHGLLLSKHLH